MRGSPSGGGGGGVGKLPRASCVGLEVLLLHAILLCEAAYSHMAPGQAVRLRKLNTECGKVVLLL